MMFSYIMLTRLCNILQFLQMKNSDAFLIFARNIDCGNWLKVAVLTSAHNLCFRVNIRKLMYIHANLNFT